MLAPNRPLLYPPVLPRPDEWGSYYLRTPAGSKAAVLPSRKANKGRFHAADHLGVPLTEGGSLRWFDTAAEALRYLQATAGEC